MEILYAISFANLLLLFFIAWRLELHRLGIFTLGFFSIGTALAPHYVFAPIQMISDGTAFAAEQTFVQAQLMVMTMLLGILVGTLCSRNRTVPFFHRIPDLQVSPRWSFSLFILIALAVLGFFAVFTGTANPLKIFAMLRTPEWKTQYADFNLGYPIYILSGCFSFLFVWCLLQLFSNPGTTKTARSTTLVRAFFVLCGGILVSATMGGRTSLFLPMVWFLFVIHHFFRRVPMVVVGGLFVAAIPIFVFSRFYAGGHTGLVADNITNTALISDEFVGRFNLFRGLLDFLHWFQSESHALGRTIVGFLIRPVPRQLLPDKPPSLDVFLSHAIYGKPQYGGGIMIYGGIVEMFYNFGFAGVFVWFVIVGYMLYRIHFGFLRLIRERRLLPVAMLLGNGALLRGMGNPGINAVGTQQILVFFVAQLVVIGGLLLWPRAGFLRRGSSQTNDPAPSAAGRPPTPAETALQG